MLEELSPVKVKIPRMGGTSREGFKYIVHGVQLCLKSLNSEESWVSGVKQKQPTSCISNQSEQYFEFASLVKRWNFEKLAG